MTFFEPGSVEESQSLGELFRGRVGITHALICTQIYVVDFAFGFYIKRFDLLDLNLFVSL